MNIKNILNRSRTFGILRKNLDIVLFLSIIFIKIMIYANQISPEYMYMKVIHPILASVFIIGSFSVLFKEKNRKKFLITLDIIISLILISDLMYFRYFKDIITISAMKNAKLLGGVSASVKSLFDFKDIFYIIDLVFIIPIVKKYKIVNKKNKSFSKKFAAFTAIFLLGVLMDVKAVYAVSKSQPTLLTSMSNRIYLTKMIGNLNFHAVDAYNYVKTTIKNSKPVSEESKTEIEDFLKQNNQTGSVQLNAVGDGKNLIMIQVEALQGFVINKKINGEEITPNLNKWINKSLYFDNYFYQVAGGNTSDAEFMSNDSLYPADSGAAYYSFSGNTYASLPKALQEKDYDTAAFHGNSEGFWNRNVMYKAQGFNNFYGEHSFNIDEEVGLGLSDKSFLNQSVEKLKQMKNPYYAFLVTLSSHYPYDDVKGYGNFNVGEYEDTLLGNYLKGIHYTDRQLGDFLDKLDKEGILDNSIVVLYGDHFAIPKENAEELYKFEGESNADDLTWFKYQKVPMLIHFPEDQYKGTNHTFGGQIDLYPTLANIFNLPKQYMMGKDLLNTKDNKVIFRNASFTDGNVFYASWTNTYYDMSSGLIIPESDSLKKKKEEYVKELNYSDDILNHNLLKNFMEKK